mmetsp:Transcript_32634/g.104519  ORF Transcript_32634/g.104519 Transcript_32634/m.104519 type:complete len:215 (-) Transcript_32634:409-1053(-)
MTTTMRTRGASSRLRRGRLPQGPTTTSSRWSMRSRSRSSRMARPLAAPATPVWCSTWRTPWASCSSLTRRSARALTRHSSASTALGTRGSRRRRRRRLCDRARPFCRTARSPAAALRSQARGRARRCCRGRAPFSRRSPKAPSGLHHASGASPTASRARIATRATRTAPRRGVPRQSQRAQPGSAASSHAAPHSRGGTRAGKAFSGAEAAWSRA